MIQPIVKHKYEFDSLFENCNYTRLKVNSENSFKEKLWGTRFAKVSSKISETISESISYDRELYTFDIRASKVHAEMLTKQNIITQKEYKNIVLGLNLIKKEIEEDKFIFSHSLEDIHTHIEKRLTELIGVDGKKLHTGRSRNDQVAVDTHLYLKDQIKWQSEQLLKLLETIAGLAEKNVDTIWCGFTHLQTAQPISLGHYLLAFFWKFVRDFQLLQFCRGETNFSPLGAAALTGSNYDVDAEFSAKKLDFPEIYPNSMDAVSTRDYQLSYHYFASRLFIHISGICEDLIIWNSTEFGYVSLDDEVTTGSSIMPQKKNPDIAELLRGKSGRVIGNLVSLLVNLKGLPMTYNRDLQDDKIYLFDSCKQTSMGILGLTEILDHVHFYPEKASAALKKGFAQATDIADHLVNEHKIPFREAHEITGRLVNYCENNNILLEDLNESAIRDILPNGVNLPKDFFDLRKSLMRKKYPGSPSPKRVKEQLKKAKKVLKSLNKTVS